MIVDSVTNDIVAQSLDLLWARQKVIANNVANADTSEAVPFRLAFDSAVSELSEMVKNGASNEEIRQELNSVDSQSWLEVSAEYDSIELNREMQFLVSNALHYQGLINARQLFSEIKSLAIKGGNN